MARFPYEIEVFEQDLRDVILSAVRGVYIAKLIAVAGLPRRDFPEISFSGD